MALNEKNILVFTDDPAIKSWVETTVGPLVKSLVHASNDVEAFNKVNNQDFDGFIVRMKSPILDNPKNIFQWAKRHKVMKSSAWIVLGKDIESEKHLVDTTSLKFLADLKDGAGLIKLLEGLFYAPDKNAAPIDVNFINPFMAAVVTVLESMGGLKLSRGKPYIKKPGMKNPVVGDVSGIIGMNSDRFMGSMAICFQEKTILKVYQNMVGAAETAINDDVKDAVAELTNIIFGNAKRDLNAVGHTLQPALPSVITGKGHEVRHPIDGLSVVIPFESSDGPIVVECLMRAR